jgi:lipopolysaccharide exporter
MKLLKTALLGVKWVTFAKIYTQVVQIVTLFILATLLNPEDFGLIGMALLVIGFLNVFRDLGISQALVQTIEYSKTILFTSFNLILLISLLLGMMVFLLAPILASIVAKESFEIGKVVPLLQLLSFGFILTGMGIVPKSQLERNLSFNKLATSEIISSTFGAIIGITLAFSGAGVYSLVFQSLINTSFLSLMMWSYSKFRPKLIINKKDIKSIWSYSINLSGFNIINYFIRNADYLIIGKFLGAEALGLYTLAYKVMLFPVANITNVISRVVFPIYSKLQDDHKQFRQIFKHTSFGISLITFPLMVGVIALHGHFINIFFEPKWEPVSLLLLILAPVGLLQSISVTTGSIYQAIGRTDLMFRWGIVIGSVTVVGFIIGTKWGVIGVAISYLITNVILLYPSIKIPFSLISLSVYEFLNNLKFVLISSIVMLGTLFVFLRLSDFLFQDQLIIFFTSAIVGLFSFILSIYFLEKEKIKNFTFYINKQ